MAFDPGFNIYFDFLALTHSDTQGKSYIYPSVPTAFNKKQKILSMNDLDKLISEFSDGDLMETVLQKHHLVRSVTDEQSLISSNVRITDLVCLWCFIHTHEITTITIH